MATEKLNFWEIFDPSIRTAMALEASKKGTLEKLMEMPVAEFKAMSLKGQRSFMDAGGKFSDGTIVRNGSKLTPNNDLGN